MEEPAFTDLKLQFGHDCRHVGCNEDGCLLCRNNPKRRCVTHFRKKYVDNARRVFNAHCDEPILARLVDAHTGDEWTNEGAVAHRLDGALLQLVVLEGISFEQKEREVGGVANMTLEHFEGMMLLDKSTSLTAEPLLVPGKDCPGEHTRDNRLLVPFKAEGTPILVRTSRSSQSAQGGRTRPFRLLARLVWADGAPVPGVAPDVSEPFVVTTRRTQAAEKAVVPVWSDSVSKLPDVGRETHAKLKDLASAGMQYPLHNYRVNTVGELHDLIDKAEPELLLALGRALGLRADKIADLQASARTVAREDSRPRVWGSPDFPHERLLYPAEDGAVDLLREHIDFARDIQDGVEVIATHELQPEDLARVIEMRRLAFESWWAPGHPGWGIIEPEDDGGAQGGGTLAKTLSLAEHMQSVSKQRRLVGPDALAGAFPDPVELEPASDGQLRSANRYIGVEQLTGPRAEPSCELHGSVVNVLASEHCTPRRSVFDVEAYPENAVPADALEQAARDFSEAHVNPNGQDIGGAMSASLLDQPMGLAYITSAPAFERSGPVRFKRSVSGNRYKPSGAESMPPAPPLFLPAGGSHQRAFSDPTLGLAPAAPPGHDAGLPPHPLLGVFSGGLPPRASRELRSQNSLDRVAFWQQTRHLSNSGRDFAERPSYSILGILEEGLESSLGSSGLLELPPELEL